ncbi:RAD50-interacting protein 1 RAD50 interactor 1 [Collichthys lucidus]|uniref:RAD50-interacting protein 1 RAD50 interactor 1 n=1 Tax=Collichthys lucidus TaxID=240159 RepID=A0A4U5VK07_COLLU|nr:RAD50-interacting protein 1 RAD50 interactor 1 [Collichthys lucidus]
MAAPSSPEKTMDKRTAIFLNSAYITSDSEYFPADSENLQHYIVDFLEKEVGNDLKSLRNVGDLLEKLTEENNVLERQVNQQLQHIFVRNKKPKKQHINVADRLIYHTACYISHLSWLLRGCRVHKHRPVAMSQYGEWIAKPEAFMISLQWANGTVLTVSSSAPPKVSAALSAAEEATCSLEALLQKEQFISNMLNQNVPPYFSVRLGDSPQHSLQAIGSSSGFSRHLQGAQPWMDNLGQLLNQVDTIERHMKYLQCLQHIEELSAAVQQCLMTSSVWEAIRAVDSMAALDAGLRESGCSHLQNFLRETLFFWHKIIKDRLASDFEKVLTQLHWPIISPPTQSLTPTANYQEISSQLELLPEWYLTQVLMWMGNSSTFMEEKIQPILERAGATISARVELCRGLLSLVQEKVASDACRLLYDDMLFCHLVEEVLQFEKELRSNHSYPAVLPGLLHLLLEDTTLQKWLIVEKKSTCRSMSVSELPEEDTSLSDLTTSFFRELLNIYKNTELSIEVRILILKVAVEKMDAMLSAEGAWSSQYKDISDMDDLKAPDCAETFMTLLQVITERYRALPCHSAQLKFLGLQRELVDDFRIRLTQVIMTKTLQY